MSEQDNLPKADGIEESESKKIDLIEENHKDQKESSSQSSVIDEPNNGEDTIDKKGIYFKIE